MAEIVNLRRFRKAKARAEEAATADVNRARHGRSAAERRVADGEVERLNAGLDGAKREKLRSAHDEATEE